MKFTWFIIYLLLKSSKMNYETYNFIDFLDGTFKDKMFRYLQTKTCQFFSWVIYILGISEKFGTKNYVWKLGITQKSLWTLLIFLARFFGPKMFRYPCHQDCANYPNSLRLLVFLFALKRFVLVLYHCLTMDQKLYQNSFS